MIGAGLNVHIVVAARWARRGLFLQCGQPHVEESAALRNQSHQQWTSATSGLVGTFSRNTALWLCHVASDGFGSSRVAKYDPGLRMDSGRWVLASDVLDRPNQHRLMGCRLPRSRNAFYRGVSIGIQRGVCMHDSFFARTVRPGYRISSTSGRLRDTASLRFASDACPPLSRRLRPR